MAINTRMSQDEKIEEITRLMRRDDSTDAPIDSLKWAKNLFRSRIAEPKPSLFRKITALLKMEIAPETTAFGERSAGGASVRQMLFDAGDNAVDLRIKKADKFSTINGQILGNGFEGAKISFEKGDDSFKAETDRQCSFRVENIPDGLYTLRITTDEMEICVEEISIGLE